MKRILIICGSGLDDVAYCEAAYCLRKDFFMRTDNVERQWRKLERMRDNKGGIVYAIANPDGALKELVQPFLDKNGYVAEGGVKLVSTSHGWFDVEAVKTGYIAHKENPALMDGACGGIGGGDDNREIPVGHWNYENKEEEDGKG